MAAPILDEIAVKPTAEGGGYFLRPKTGGDIVAAIAQFLSNALDDAVMAAVRTMHLKNVRWPRNASETAALVRKWLPRSTVEVEDGKFVLTVASKTTEPIDEATRLRLMSVYSQRPGGRCSSRSVDRRSRSSHKEAFLSEYHTTYTKFVKLTGWGLTGGEGRGASDAAAVLFGATCLHLSLRSCRGQFCWKIVQDSEGADYITGDFMSWASPDTPEEKLGCNTTRIVMTDAKTDLHGLQSLKACFHDAQSRLFPLAVYDSEVRQRAGVVACGQAGVCVSTRSVGKNTYNAVTHLWNVVRSLPAQEACFGNGWRVLDGSEHGRKGLWLVSMTLIPRCTPIPAGAQCRMKSREPWLGLLNFSWPKAINGMRIDRRLLNQHVVEQMFSQKDCGIDHRAKKLDEIFLSVHKLFLLHRTLSPPHENGSIECRLYGQLVDPNKNWKALPQRPNFSVSAPFKGEHDEPLSPTSVQDIQESAVIPALGSYTRAFAEAVLTCKGKEDFLSMKWMACARAYRAPELSLYHSPSQRNAATVFQNKYKSQLDRIGVKLCVAKPEIIGRHLLSCQFPVLQLVMRFCDATMIRKWFKSSKDTVETIYELAILFTALFPNGTLNANDGLPLLDVASDAAAGFELVVSSASRSKLCAPLHVKAVERQGAFWCDALKNVCGTYTTPAWWGHATPATALRCVGAAAISRLISLERHQREKSRRNVAATAKRAKSAIVAIATSGPGFKWYPALHQVPLRVLLVCDLWGREKGGIPVFNMELCCALATSPWPLQVVCAITKDQGKALESQLALHARRARKGKFHILIVKQPTAKASAIRDEGKDHSIVSDRELAGRVLKQTQAYFGGENPNAVIGHDIFSGPLARHIAGRFKPTRRPFCGIVAHCDTHTLDHAKAQLHGDNRDVDDRLNKLNQKCFYDDGSPSPTLLYVAKGASDSRVNTSFRVPLFAGLSHAVGNDGRKYRRSDKITVVCVGRLDDTNKGGAQQASANFKSCLLGAIGDFLKERNFDGELRLIGFDGDSQSPLAGKIRQWRTDSYNGSKFAISTFPFTTSPERLSAQLSAASLVIAPSLSETGPLTAIEAISCGTPVLVTENCRAGDELRRMAQELHRPILHDCVLPVTNNDVENGKRWAGRIMELMGAAKRDHLFAAFNDVLEAWDDWDETTRNLWVCMQEHLDTTGPPEVDDVEVQQRRAHQKVTANFE